MTEGSDFRPVEHHPSGVRAYQMRKYPLKKLRIEWNQTHTF